ncbi:MAG TPA: ABC transporter permease [Chitinispirillaceae bacterium]|nr:ABC transporter permease [Chitinispirillaceae bacterium]
MHSSKDRLFPSTFNRIYSVWFRHFRVYTKSLISNGLPPFLEPLIFLAGIGLGMNKYVKEMAGIPYITFLATGLPITAAMFTSAFELTYGTFIRLEFDKVYDGMLASPLSVKDLMIGEILWAGTKGLFFSFAVIVVVTSFGLIPLPWSLFTPIIGFLTGIMFATISLLITTFVKNINHFNFYFTGFLSPMFFFSGVVFPIENLPPFLRVIAEFFPLTHVVRPTRALCLGNFSTILLADLLFIVAFTFITGWPAINRIRKKLIN